MHKANIIAFLALCFICSAIGQSCTATDALNVRSCPGTGCSIVGSLPAGSNVNLVSQEAPSASGHQWGKIGEGRWVARTYLSCHSGSPNPPPAPVGGGGSIVSASQFQCMFPRVSSSKINEWMPYLNSVLSRYGINTLPRVQMFLAQTGHETDGFNTFSEYVNADGTNPWCRNYNGGCRYRGRGAIQLTHQYNYKRAGDELGVDFVNNPEIVATPRYAFEVGGLFWKWNSLNTCSDSRDMTTCTRKINGGTNGIDDRRNKYSSAQRCITSLGARALVDSDSTYSNAEFTVSTGAASAIVAIASLLTIAFMAITVMLVVKVRTL